MNVEILNISPKELQEALLDWCQKNAKTQVNSVQVVSYDKVRVSVDLVPGGMLMTFGEMRHAIR